MELKNDISIRGTLKSVDQYLNIKLDDITVVDELKYPHLVSHTLRKIECTATRKHMSWVEFHAVVLCVVCGTRSVLHANAIEMQSSVKNVFIRGSVVRYVHLPAAAVETPLLEDATRRGMITSSIVAQESLLIHILDS